MQRMTICAYPTYSAGYPKSSYNPTPHFLSSAEVLGKGWGGRSGVLLIEVSSHGVGNDDGNSDYVQAIGLSRLCQIPKFQLISESEGKERIRSTYGALECTSA